MQNGYQTQTLLKAEPPNCGYLNEVSELVGTAAAEVTNADSTTVSHVIGRSR